MTPRKLGRRRLVEGLPLQVRPTAGEPEIAISNRQFLAPSTATGMRISMPPPHLLGDTIREGAQRPRVHPYPQARRRRRSLFPVSRARVRQLGSPEADEPAPGSIPAEGIQMRRG